MCTSTSCSVNWRIATYFGFVLHSAAYQKLVSKANLQIITMANGRVIRSLMDYHSLLNLRCVIYVEENPS